MIAYDAPPPPTPYSLHASTTASRSAARMPVLTKDKKSLGYQRKAWDLLLGRYGWKNRTQFRCLVLMWDKESGWRTNSNNNDGMDTWGIPQAHPGYKMRSSGADWKTNPVTQMRWGLRYIKSAYGTPCNAWGHWQYRAGSDGYGGWY